MLWVPQSTNHWEEPHGTFYQWSDQQRYDSGTAAEWRQEHPWELRRFYWNVPDPPELRPAVLGLWNIPMEAAVVLRFLRDVTIPSIVKCGVNRRTERLKWLSKIAAVQTVGNTKEKLLC